VVTLTCVSSVCRRTEAESAAVSRRLEAARNDFKASAEAAIERWFPESDDQINQIDQIRTVLLANDRESYLHAYEVFATGDRQIAPKLPLITAPTLAVTGAEDPGSTPDMTRRLAEAIPGARAVIVPGARHMLPIERPEELARLIAERTALHD
jgi:pimeloyl-ACP methyl ester carboxylesterase